MQVLFHFLIWIGNLPQGKGFSLLFLHQFSIFLSYPWFADTLFMCSSALPSLPPLLEFGIAQAVGDVSIPTPTFPFPLTSPSEILLGKELRPMALPTKSWPRESENWITWVDKVIPLFPRTQGVLRYCPIHYAHQGERNPLFGFDEYRPKVLAQGFEFISLPFWSRIHHHEGHFYPYWVTY